MSAVPAMLAMFYGALPPEVNTGRLMLGAGASPMLQAAAGWEALAISLETQADELASSLSALSASWQGTGSERAVTATMPMVTWLHTTAMQAQKRAMQAIAQATSYTTALVTTPPLPEICDNQITHGVLEATNFMGVNAMPIGFNEADYIRMWVQAAGVMEGYQAETSLNTVFEPIPPSQPIAMPGVGEATMAASVGMAAAMMPEAAMRNLMLGHVTGQSLVEDAALMAGNAGAQLNYTAQRAEGQAERSETAAQQGQQAGQMTQQGGQMVMQVASQLGSQFAQAPQQVGQMVSQPVQQLSSPLQQMTQLFSQLGSSMGQPGGPQIGMLGASPFSDHPLAGGSGAASGMGLVRAASLPGMGGSSARTPLMASLVGEVQNEAAAPKPAAVGGAAQGSAGAGRAPVSGGAGGAMGAHGKGEKDDGGHREEIKAHGMLVQDLDDEDDDW